MSTNDDNPFRSPSAESAPQSPPPAKGVGQFAACPNCQGTEAKKVGFTLWGGALGPAMFTHVSCTSCKTKYNGKTGQSNATAITIYVVVSIIIFGALGLFFGQAMR